MPFDNINSIYNAIKKYGKKSVFLRGFFTLSMIIFVLTFGIIAVFSVHSSNIYDKKNLGNLLTELYSSRNRYDSIKEQVESLNSDLLAANDLLYLAANDKEKLSELIKAKNEELSFLYSIYCYLPNENYVISTSKIYESADFERFLDKSWYQPYKQGEKFFYRELADVGLIAKCFSFVEEMDTAVVVYNVDYSKMFPNTGKMENNRVYMISPMNTVIYADDRQPDKEKINGYIAAFRNADEKQSSYARSYKTLYETVLLLGSKKDSIGFISVFPRRWTETVTIWKMFLSLVCSLIISMILAFFFVIKLYKPFTRIVEIEKNIRKPQFESNNEVNSILNYVLNLTLRRQKVEGQLAQNSILLQNAQVLALQSQLSPHFLFNTLQLLNSMILAETKRDTPTTKVIVLLSRLLREAIDMSEFFSPFSKEVELSNIYLEIQRIKYPGRFNVIWEYDDNVRDLKVPKSVLQPLLENAMAYGIRRTKEKGIIEIKAFLRDDMFYISVKDNGAGFEPEKLREINEILSGEERITTEHIGLSNVNQRIKVLFGQEYGLRVLSAGGAEIIIRLPAEPYEVQTQDEER